MAAKMAKWAAVPATLACASINVSAAMEEEPKSQPVKPHQLSFYNEPTLKSRYVDEKPGGLQSGISSVRKSTGYYIDGLKNVYFFIKNGVISSIQFGKDAYVYLKNPPPEFLPKVGAITISGLTGIVLAKKGSRFKKIAYPVGLSALCISLCYPAQSIVVAKVSGRKLYSASHKTYEAIGSLWTKPSTSEVPLVQDKVAKEAPVSRTDQSISEVHTAASESEEKAEAHQTPFHAGKTVAESNSVPLIAKVKVPSVISDAVKVQKFTPDPNLMDHGQSSPEDVDMYSTRS
ncbi:MICOS complex subunit MIC27 isoform X2 [Sphaerodactylus townsendi]|uniref:MICOS complex subunit MIC27 isoform X2 n=1 Tax=Sphaerodactylus townsendi TaxID=933632 RepID=UPI0020269C63|nr:MICOS complex subunit MIC27 isoform X2 [Sphaerodactylus townsendi]